MPSPFAETLRECQLFAEVKSPGFEQLVDIARTRSFQKGETIFRQGQECPGVYLVEAGLVRVFKVAPNGKEHVLHMVGPGSTFAEVAAIGNFPCPAHAQAVSATTCLLLPTDLFQRLLHENHTLCLEMMTGLTFWVKHLIDLMEDIVLRDATGRLARYLLHSQDETHYVELPTLKRYVASHLNLTSETFSRTLTRLIESRLIVELEGNRLQILDPERLELLAEGAT